MQTAEMAPTETDQRRAAEQRGFLGAILFAAGTALTFGLLAGLASDTFSTNGAFVGIFAGLLIYTGLWLLVNGRFKQRTKAPE